jgi:hypothetical protein
LSGSGENRRTGESNAGTATVTQAEAMLQADTHESNADTDSVAHTESMVEAGARESNTGTTGVTGNSERTTKGKVVGEKRK